MIYIFDTNSWVSLIRYYKPFDKEAIIYDFFKRKIGNGTIILLDEVSKECSYVSKKIVVNELDFIADKKFITKTKELLPTKSYYNLLENQFCNKNRKRTLTEAEIEVQTNTFLSSADSKIILKSLSLKKGTIFSDVTVVTEETSSNNDSKLFKKIPLMCKELSVGCITLPKFIESFNEEIRFFIKMNDTKPDTKSQ